MKIRLALITGVLAGLGCASALSQDYTPFPGESPDHRTVKTQERVDELYNAGDFERAFFIYEKELAPRGDKYAQYMVGFMHLNGQGVPQDSTRALAWYRLAAERGQGPLEGARDELAASMQPDEIEVSDQIFLELLKEIGDTALIMMLIRKDMDTLKTRTGTHISRSSVSGPVMIIRPSGQSVGPDYYDNIRRRLEARLNYLETTVKISDIEVEADNEELQQFEEQIKSELAAIEVP